MPTSRPHSSTRTLTARTCAASIWRRTPALTCASRLHGSTARVSYGVAAGTRPVAPKRRHSGGFVRSCCGNCPCGAELTPQRELRTHLLRELALWRQNGAASASLRPRPPPPHTAPHPLPHRRLHPTDTIRFPAFAFLAAGVVSPLPATTTCGATAASSLTPLKAPSNRLGPKVLLVCRKVFLGVARCRFWAIVCSRSNVGASGNERRATC